MQQNALKVIGGVEANASLDAAFSKIALIGDLPSNDAQEGWVGMKRFEEWKTVETGEDMKMGVFEFSDLRGCYGDILEEESI